MGRSIVLQVKSIDYRIEIRNSERSQLNKTDVEKFELIEKELLKIHQDCMNQQNTKITLYIKKEISDFYFENDTPFQIFCEESKNTIFIQNIKFKEEFKKIEIYVPKDKEIILSTLPYSIIKEESDGKLIFSSKNKIKFDNSEYEVSIDFEKLELLIKNKV
jgi:hypothetical protein